MNTEGLMRMIGPFADGVELIGVVLMVVGGLLAFGFAGRTLLHGGSALDAYRTLRAGIGRAILLGLELLVAADIIQTILIHPTVTSAAALGLIVLIRTFLSFSLETELEGTVPWRRKREAAEPTPPRAA